MRLFLIISQIFYVLLGVLWFVFWAMSVMMFDAGVTTSAAIIFGILSLYPVAVIVCGVLAWLFYRKKRRRAALYVNLVPMLWVVAVIAIELIISLVGIGASHT